MVPEDAVTWAIFSEKLYSHIHKLAAIDEHEHLLSIREMPPHIAGMPLIAGDFQASFYVSLSWNAYDGRRLPQIPLCQKLWLTHRRRHRDALDLTTAVFPGECQVLAKTRQHQPKLVASWRAVKEVDFIQDYSAHISKEFTAECQKGFR